MSYGGIGGNCGNNNNCYNPCNNNNSGPPACCPPVVIRTPAQNCEGQMCVFQLPPVNIVCEIPPPQRSPCPPKVCCVPIVICEEECPQNNACNAPRIQMTTNACGSRGGQYGNNGTAPIGWNAGSGNVGNGNGTNKGQCGNNGNRCSNGVCRF